MAVLSAFSDSGVPLAGTVAMLSGSAAVAPARAEDRRRVMLQRCAHELLRTAPNYNATQRALDLLTARCPPWRFWRDWLAIAGVLLFLLLCALPRAAAADEPSHPHGWLSKWPVDDVHPEGHIPSEKERNADPLEFGYWLQDVSLKGEHASKLGKHEEAAKFYSVLAQVVPDRAVGFIKTCEEYEAAGERDKAINSCGEALLRDGLTVKDYTHFVHLILSKPGRLSDKETGALGQVLLHMREDPAGRDFADDLECEIGTRTSNVAQLKECTAALATRAPDDPKTISYLWALAIQEGKYDVAEGLIERARAMGVAQNSVDNMKQATRGAEKRRWRKVLLAIAAIALFLGSLGVTGRALLRRRLEPKVA